jgi:hypothetical protein
MSFEFWQYGHLKLHPAAKIINVTFPYQSTVDVSTIPPILKVSPAAEVVFPSIPFASLNKTVWKLEEGFKLQKCTVQ